MNQNCKVISRYNDNLDYIISETDAEYQDAHTDPNQMGHTCDTMEANHPKPGKVGRLKAKIAPGCYKGEKTCSAHKQFNKESIKGYVLLLLYSFGDFIENLLYPVDKILLTGQVTSDILIYKFVFT